MTSLYLYAIVERPPRAPLGRGIARRPLRTVRAAGSYVVVENAVAPAVTAANVRAHDRVVRRIARVATATLPFRYGSVVADRAALDALLEPLAPSIARALERVRGCVQFTLRVYGRPKPASRPPPSRATGPGTRWLEKRVRARTVPEIALVRDNVAPLLRAERVERHDRAPLLASVYHLVPSTDVPRYRAIVARASRALAGVRVETSGPWPAYAFTEMT